MTDKEKVMQVFYQFEEEGLVSMNLEKVMECLDENLIGVGIGEQGIVTSIEDVCKVFYKGQKNNSEIKHSLTFEHINILTYEEGFANLCAKVIVRAEKRGELTISEFYQTLSLIRRGGEWKICALHASVPIVTEESVEAYPLKFAEKTLQSLKEKIGEEVYQVEEQYRQAVLADTVAFYIIDFSMNLFEKCQLNGDLCVYVEPGTAYEEFIAENLSQYVAEEDQVYFLETLSLKSVNEAFGEGKTQLSCEYHFLCPDGSTIWMETNVRLIKDIATGSLKGIMYVKDIDAVKRKELEMIANADIDTMTGVLNKGAFLRAMSDSYDSERNTFIMVDIDNFKKVNDTYGHPAGDQVLIEVASILKDNFSADGIVGRLGGDEFGVFVQGIPQDISARLDWVLEQLSKIKHCNESSDNITCSMGVAFGENVRDIRQLYKNADDALYVAKQRGKNQIAIWEESSF